MASFIDQAGTTRFEGTITGAGITAVTCALEAVNIDIHTAAGHALLWSVLKDNPWDWNTLTAIPDGLGLAFLFNGTDATITTTDDGTWAFSMVVSFAQDAAWTGFVSLDQNSVMEQAGVGNVPGPRIAVSEVVTYPAGASFNPQVVTDTQSTATPLAASAILTIVRLG